MTTADQRASAEPMTDATLPFGEAETWAFADKTSWPDGPWKAEPDKLQWTDPETGLTCMMRRHPRLGHWCGYVGISSGHPMHGKGHDEPDVDVHGGLTYAALCDGDEERCICHRPAPGEPDDLWWLGFDCAHYRDLSPGLNPILLFGDEVYRDVNYVRRECKALASQLASHKASPR